MFQRSVLLRGNIVQYISHLLWVTLYNQAMVYNATQMVNYMKLRSTQGVSGNVYKLQSNT